MWVVRPEYHPGIMVLNSTFPLVSVSRYPHHQLCPVVDSLLSAAYIPPALHDQISTCTPCIAAQLFSLSNTYTVSASATPVCVSVPSRLERTLLRRYPEALSSTKYGPSSPSNVELQAADAVTVTLTAAD